MAKEIQFKIKKVGNSDRDIHRSLKDIYHHGGSQYPDIGRLERKKRNWLLKFLVVAVIFLVILAGVAYLGFFIFNKQAVSDEGQVIFQIESSERVKSGSEVEFKLIYKNQKEIALREVEIDVIYPEGFVYQKADQEPINDQKSIWRDENVLAGEVKEIKITGQMIGEADSQKDLRATLTYKPANFNSEFKEVAQHTLKIALLELEVKIDGPEKTAVEKEVVYTVDYKNDSSKDINNIQLRLELPKSFKLLKIEPEEMKSNYILKIDKLAYNEKDQIIITGQYSKDAELETGIKVEIYLLGEGGIYYKQSEARKTTQIISQGLSLDLIMNGSKEDQALDINDNLNYSIVYKNVGDDSLSDISISIQINSEIVDWDSLDDVNKGEFLVDEIVWTKEEVPELTLLEPGEEGAIDFKLKLKDKEKILALSEDMLNIESSAEAIIGQSGEVKAEIKILSNKVINVLNSNFNLRVEARYFDFNGVTVGSGPLPPKINQETKYRVFWYLENSLHELNNIKVSLVLPDQVTWSGDYDVTAGELKYNSVTREVIWRVNWMPLDVGVLQADFSVSITPRPEDLDKILLVTNKTSAEAMDVTTNKTIIRDFKALGTDLEFDSSAEGKGMIVD